LLVGLAFTSEPNISMTPLVLAGSSVVCFGAVSGFGSSVSPRPRMSISSLLLIFLSSYGLELSFLLDLVFSGD